MFATVTPEPEPDNDVDISDLETDAPELDDRKIIIYADQGQCKHCDNIIQQIDKSIANDRFKIYRSKEQFPRIIQTRFNDRTHPIKGVAIQLPDSDSLISGEEASALLGETVEGKQATLLLLQDCPFSNEIAAHLIDRPFLQLLDIHAISPHKIHENPYINIAHEHNTKQPLAKSSPNKTRSLQFPVLHFPSGQTFTGADVRPRLNLFSLKKLLKSN
jgi:hypothetical protein